MTDRELLEAAAEAAGYVVSRWSDDGRGLLLVGEQDPWSPLTDDGDAFRLAVKLMIDVEWVDRHLVLATNPPDHGVAESTRNDPYSATRRAIVRAAAALTDMESNE